MRFPKVLPFEWAALVLLIVSVATLVGLDEDPLFAFWAILLWVPLTLGFVIGGFITAGSDPMPRNDRIRTAIAAPLALMICFVFGPALSEGYAVRNARAHLAAHRQEYAGKVAANPGKALRFLYKNRMLGAGEDIVHSTQLPIRRDLGLADDDSLECQLLEPGYFLCRYG